MRSSQNSPPHTHESLRPVSLLPLAMYRCAPSYPTRACGLRPPGQQRGRGGPGPEQRQRQSASPMPQELREPCGWPPLTPGGRGDARHWGQASGCVHHGQGAPVGHAAPVSGVVAGGLGGRGAIKVSAVFIPGRGGGHHHNVTRQPVSIRGVGHKVSALGFARSDVDKLLHVSVPPRLPAEAGPRISEAVMPAQTRALCTREGVITIHTTTRVFVHLRSGLGQFSHSQSSICFEILLVAAHRGGHATTTFLEGFLDVALGRFLQGGGGLKLEKGSYKSSWGDVKKGRLEAHREGTKMLFRRVVSHSHSGCHFQLGNITAVVTGAVC